MSTGWTRVIEGYYKCPVQFAVTTSALTAAYSASLGGHPVTITLPSAAGTSMHHNDLAEPDWHYPERDNPLSRLPELAPYWGQVVVWANDHTTPKAVSVRRFRIATDAAGNDDEVRDVGRQLAEAAPAWWAAVSAWIEILHHQDLSRLGPIEPGMHFNDTTLWTQLYSVSALPDGAGPASQLERSTRGTGVYVSQGWIGSKLVDMGGERCVPTCSSNRPLFTNKVIEVADAQTKVDYFA